MDSSVDLAITRRSSSGGLLSPEVDLGTTHLTRSSAGDSELDGFYLLKKDSQRRTTLSRVLEQDGEKICAQWMSSIRQDLGATPLRMSHLELLISALRVYIMEQDRQVIENAVTTLKEELDFDSDAINQIHLAIYLFHEAVNAILRMHSIKPHWMFALDNLVRNAAQAAITVLSPELGANLAGQDGQPRTASRVDGPGAGGSGDAGSAAPSTVNSIRSHNTAASFRPSYHDTPLIHQLRADNNRLVQELVDCQQSYQTLLKQMLEEHKLQVQVMSELCYQMGYSVNTNPERSQNPVMDSIDGLSNSPYDDNLIKWLLERGVANDSVQKIASEEYTLDDLLNHIQREDLSKLRLKGGVELRIWRAIVDHRCLTGASNPAETLRRGSTETDFESSNSIVVVECQRCKTNGTPVRSNPIITINDRSEKSTHMNGLNDESECYVGNGIINL